MTLKIEYRTSEFEASHGHLPRGRGSWAFEVEGNLICAKDEVGCMSLTYGDAKKHLRRILLAAGMNGWVVVEVAP